MSIDLLRLVQALKASAELSHDEAVQLLLTGLPESVRGTSRAKWAERVLRHDAGLSRQEAKAVFHHGLHSPRTSYIDRTRLPRQLAATYFAA